MIIGKGDTVTQDGLLGIIIELGIDEDNQIVARVLWSGGHRTWELAADLEIVKKRDE